MNIISVKEAEKRVNEYVLGKITQPFFIVVAGSKEYKELLDTYVTWNHIRVSDFCNTDSFPDFDRLEEAIKQIPGNSVLLGLGENEYLSGDDEFLGKLQGSSLVGKIVVLYHNGIQHINRINESDKKFNSRRYCVVSTSLDYAVTVLQNAKGVSACEGYKALLKKLEGGAAGNLNVNSCAPINAYRVISSSYEVIRGKNAAFSVPREALEDSMWDKYASGVSLDGKGLFEWQTFLKFKINLPSGEYLRRVVDATNNYKEFKKNLINLLLTFDVNDKIFPKVYSERKKLCFGLTDADMAEYIGLSKQKDYKRIFYLTDNTSIEKMEIVKEVSNMGVIPDKLSEIYPDLSAYLKSYAFSCEDGEGFTEYFKMYKQQKVLNYLDPDFNSMVDELAKDGNRAYTKLTTRGKILETLDDGKTTLYWVDAMGGEYLGFIQEKAREYDLRITVDVARASIPTLTSENREFFDVWKGDKTFTDEVDKVKHEGTRGFNRDHEHKPIHLVEELRYIDQTLKWARETLLSDKTKKKIVITSDHGATRLPILSNQKPILMENTGEHAGRCCRISDCDTKPITATESNGWFVLADYHRFSGGKRKGMEVHGGASLEEVLVPVIQVELIDKQIEVKIKDPSVQIKAGIDIAPEIVIFSEAKIDKPHARMGGNDYCHVDILDDNTYRFILDGWIKGGSEILDILDGDSIIGSVEVEIQNMIGGNNNSDDFFNW